VWGDAILIEKLRRCLETILGLRARFGVFLEQVCVQLTESGVFDWAGVYWLRRGRVELVALSGRYDMKMRLDMGEGVVGKAAQEGELVCAETLGDLWGKRRGGVCIAVPIEMEKRVVGVLAAGLEGKNELCGDVKGIFKRICEEVGRRYAAAQSRGRQE